jgi:hypothetical protein
MIKTRIRHKRDTLENWYAKNPILLKGEFAIVENGNEILLKCGNGTNNFNQLPFVGADVDVSTLATKQEVADLESSLYTVISEHANNTSNPHGITKVTLNLGNVDNTADSTKTVKAAKTAESATKATQDASGNVITDTYATKVELSDTYGAATTYADQKVNGLKYAGSSTTGGAATSANKLNSNAGSATQPIYFENGVPKATSYSLGKSVPSDAVFTDTKYTHPSYTAKSSGLYKVTVDSTGHVSAATAVAKSDITALGIPAQDTTYTLSSFGVTASAAELNALDGITATVTELNYVDGVTSNIQTQLNAKAPTASPTFTGTVTAPTVTVTGTLNIPGGKIWIA